MTRAELAALVAAWAATLVCLAGLAAVLGVSIAPWAGWSLALAASAALAYRLTVRALDDTALRRDIARSAADPPHRPGPSPTKSLDY